MKEKRRPGLLGYFTLALMTATIVVCVLAMLILERPSLGVLLGTVPVLLIIDWIGHRLELSMGEHLPKRLWDGLMRLLIWGVAVLVLWVRYEHSGLTPDFALLLLVIVQALTLLLRVIHAMGEIKEKATGEAEKTEEQPPAEELHTPEESEKSSSEK